MKEPASKISGHRSSESDLDIRAIPNQTSDHSEGWKIVPIITSLWLGTMLVAIDNTIIG
jgi:hypothetical protein